MTKIDVSAIESALNTENSRIDDYATLFTDVTGQYSAIAANDALTGSGYSAMRGYFQYVGVPAFTSTVDLVRCKKGCNEQYLSSLRNNLGGRGVVDLDALRSDREKIAGAIQTLSRIDNPLETFAINLVTMGFFNLVKTGVQHIYNLVDEEIARAEKFLNETSNTYDSFYSKLGEAQTGLGAAEGAYNGSGFDLTASQVTRSYIAAQGGKTLVSFCPEWASNVNEFGPGPGDAGYVEDSYERFRAADGGIYRVSTWNKPGELSCTFYTLRKLRERGINYPFAHSGANGSQWFSNCDESVPGAGGRNCIQELYNTYGELTNVVVSFPNDAGGYNAGHVVLIDRVFMGDDGQLHVIFSDNYPPITDANGSNSTQNITYEEFLSKYARYNGTPTGARYLGGSC